MAGVALSRSEAEKQAAAAKLANEAKLAAAQTKAIELKSLGETINNWNLSADIRQRAQARIRELII
jgi:hypothetical protein|eukprot:COSAG06_NODE_7171_length_2599_cov_1.955200_5_plen_66_part_00